MLNTNKGPKIGLALSGGGARGLAHVGVLKVLDREKIPIQLLAGTSAGGIVGAMYAAGHSPQEIERVAIDLTTPRQLVTLVDRILPRRGLIKGHKVVEYLSQWLGDLTFDQLAIPLAVVAVDLNKGKKVMLSEGKVLDAVMATIALPGLFPPVEIGGQMLVDGGLLDNLPTDAVLLMGAEIVIAVDISTGPESVDLFTSSLHSSPLIPDGLASLLDVMWRSVNVVAQEISQRCLEDSPPDLLIRPPLPPEITTITGLDRAQEAIAVGEQSMEEALPRLRELIDSKQKPLGRLRRWLRAALPGD